MKSLLKLFWISLAVKLLVAALLPMTSDESYYWVWALHPQLNYYDHPAMISWLYLFGRPLENLGSMIRWPGVFLSHGTLFVWLILLKRHLQFSEGQMKAWLWLALLHPLFGAGALIITPDIPLLFFAALSLLCFLNLAEKPDWKNGLIFGVTLGLGLISKYMIVLVPMAVLVASVWNLSWWRRIAPHLPVIFVGFFMGALPFFLWNMQNDWISVKFQLDHGLGAVRWKPSWTTEYVLLQIGLLFPPLIYLMVKGWKDTPTWLKCMTLVPFLFFLKTSFGGYVEANWPIMAYPAALAWAVCGGGERIQFWTRWFWGIIIGAASFLIITQYSPFTKPIKTREFYEFEVLYPIAKEKSPVFARSYQMAARLSFEVKKPIYKLRGFNRVDSNDFWEGSIPPEHFYLIFEKGDVLPQKYLDEGFQVVGESAISEKFRLLEVQKKGG